MTDAPILGSIAAERELRLRARGIQDHEVERLFSDSLAPFAGTELESRARHAFEFANGIDYDHPGLSAAAYLAHPVRVASLVLRVVRLVAADATILALLHNVFELSKVTPQTIAAQFGAPISKAIEVLTVDRSQTTHEYTTRYYAALRAMPPYVRIVKVLDKMDNMFVLGLNPSAAVRAQYLADIEEFVVPMVAADLPQLSSYFAELIEDCRRTGFLDAATHS
jgi:(p)ppGpp synthase/HD superfamily hydrolase